jgi:hypothetical protein
MIFSAVIFITSWICFLLFADKKKFFGFLPTCYLAMVLGLMTDVLTFYYPLWNYPAPNGLGKIFRRYSDELGVYFIVTYLFIQTLPLKLTIFKLIKHIFYWSVLAFSLEVIAVTTGSMKYGLWWGIGYSYICDWILFIIFYNHYKLLKKHQNIRNKA